MRNSIRPVLEEIAVVSAGKIVDVAIGGFNFRRSKSFATAIRHASKYSIGGSPTVRINRSKNADRATVRVVCHRPGSRAIAHSDFPVSMAVELATARMIARRSSFLTAGGLRSIGPNIAQRPRTSSALHMDV